VRIISAWPRRENTAITMVLEEGQNHGCDLIYRKGQKVGLHGAFRQTTSLKFHFQKQMELDENVLCNNQKLQNSKEQKRSTSRYRMCHHWAGRGSSENCVSSQNGFVFFFLISQYLVKVLEK